MSRRKIRRDVTVESATTRPPEDTLAILRLRWSRPGWRCSPGCRGWFLGEGSARGTEPQSCDECNALARDRGGHTLRDDDLMAVPRIRRALARAIAPMPLAEYDLRVALTDIRAWAAHVAEAKRIGQNGQSLSLVMNAAIAKIDALAEGALS